MTSDNEQWYPVPQIVQMGEGAIVKLHKVAGSYYTGAVTTMRSKLNKKWGIPAQGDLTLEEISQVLAELGYNLLDIAARRGDDREYLSEAQQLDIEHKERADLCEILAGMAQEKIRQIPEDDIFTAFQRKTTVATAEHGKDYMAFKFDETHAGVLPRINETLVLGESKYTSSTSSINAACRATASWILNRLTTTRLYQELKINADEYGRRGQHLKKMRALGFILSIFSRDEKLVVSSTILCDDSIPDTKAVSDFEVTIPAALDSHKEGPIPHERFEALLFKVTGLESFCESCYKDIRRGSG